MIGPKVKKKGHSPEDGPTCCVMSVATASCMALYMAAKAYHLNVTGASFYGDHKTYDGIADVAIEWYDTLAERMRFLKMPVPSSMEWVLAESCLPTTDIEYDSEEMLASMLAILEAFSAFLNTELQNFDPTSQNIIQELDADLGKQIYFVRSSM